MTTIWPKDIKRIKETMTFECQVCGYQETNGQFFRWEIHRGDLLYSHEETISSVMLCCTCGVKLMALGFDAWLNKRKETRAPTEPMGPMDSPHEHKREG